MASPATKSPLQKAFIVQVLACLIGAALSLYLLVQHTRLKSGIQGSASFCSFGKYADCDVVGASKYAEIFGVPIAAMGACFYFGLLIFSLLAPPKSKSAPSLQKWIAWLCLPALAYDLFLLVVQIVDLQNFCVLCLLTYLCSLVICVTATAIKRRGFGSPAALAKSLFRKPEFTERVQIPNALIVLGFMGFAAFATLTAFIPSMLRVQSYNYVNSAMDSFFAKWKDMPVKKFTVNAGDATLGNPTAKVQIVEFSDFECPHCKKAAFTLHTTMKVLKDRVFFVFKHFPLDQSCNELVSFQMHPNACNLARLAFCAVDKKNFWEYHDKVFFDVEADERKHMDLSKEIKEGALKSIFTEAEYKACLSNPRTLQRVKDDIRQGINMGIKGTPTLFINGKHVTIPFTLENIEKLVKLEESM